MMWRQIRVLELFFELSPIDVAAPTGLILNTIASDDRINKVEHDGVTLLTGEAEANAKITITFTDSSGNVDSTRSVRADEFGNWSLAYASQNLPDDDTYTVSVTATDAAGNASAPVARIGVIIDSVIPTGLAIDGLLRDDIVDAVDNRTGFTITGTGEAGATVTISFSGSGHTLQTDSDADGDANSNTVTVSQNGTWSFTVAPKEAGNNFDEGEEVITVVQTDSAGNSSSAVTKLINVVATLIANGDQSAVDMSAVTILILNGDLTALPDATAKLPKAINANGFDITAADTGVDLSGVNIFNVDSLNINAGVVLTMSPAQATLFNNGGGITLVDATSSVAAVTSGGDLSAQNLANVTLTLNASTTLPDTTAELPKSVDAVSTHKIILSESVDISNVPINNAPALEIAANKNITMQAAQHNAFTSIIANGAGQTITLSNAGTLTGAGSVETYVLADGGGSTFTLGAAGQNVTSGNGADTIDFAGLTATGEVNTVAADTLVLDDGADIKGVNAEGNGAGTAFTANAMTLTTERTGGAGGNTDGSRVTMTVAQHNSVTIAAAGTGDQITLSTAGTLTGSAAVESYVLAAGTQTFTLGLSGQNVTADATGVTGAITIDTGALTSVTGTFDTSTGDDSIALSLTTDTVDISQADTTDVTAIALANNVGATMTRDQNSLINAASGTNTVTLADAGAATGNAAVESYVLAAGTQTFTLGLTGQNVTADAAGATGAITIDTGALTSVTGAFDTSTGTDSIALSLTTDTVDISQADTTDVTAIALANNVGATMTRDQNSLINAASGTNTVTLADAGAATGNAAVESYVLAAGTQTFTLGLTGQNVTADAAGATGAITIDTGALTSVTGTFDTSTGDDSIALSLTTDTVDISQADTTDVTAIALANNVGATMTRDQNSLINAASGTNTVTLADAGAATGNAAVESYVLAAGTQTFTLGLTGQNVTADAAGATGAITIDTGALTSVTGTFDTSTGDDSIALSLTTDTVDISQADTTDVTAIALANNVGATMTRDQNSLINAASGTNTVTLADAGAATGNAAVESYVLAAGTQTFTLGLTGQNVTADATGATGAITIDTGALTSVTGTFDTSTGDDSIALSLTTDTVDISQADTTDVTAIALANNVGATMTRDQNSLINAASGTNTVTLADAGAATGNAAVESYVLAAAGGTTFTLGDAAQNVTTGGNGDTIDVGGFTATGIFNTVAADTVSLANGADLSGADGEGNGAGAALDATNLTLATGSSVTMSASQHAGFSGTVTAAGTTGGGDGETITLSGGGNVTALAAVETYILGDEGRTITLADAGQNVTGGIGADTINTASLATLTGIINGGTGANKLVTGANLDISGASSFSNIQSIEIGGDFTLDVTRAQLDAIAITQTTGTSATVRIASDGANADQFDLAGSATLDITASDVAIAFLDGNAPSAVTTLVLGAGSSLNLTAAQAATAGGELTINDGEGAAVVTVEELEGLTSADLTRITVDTLRAEVAVSSTTTLTGDLNNAALAITSVASTPALDLTAAGSVDSIDFNDLTLEVVLTTTQYTENNGLFVADVANTQTVQLVNGTGSLATVTQLSGIETYKLNASTNADHITFNTLEADDSVNLTRLGDAGATVTIAVDGAATFDGIWSGFVAGDTLAIAGTGAIVVNVESVTNDGSAVSLGGIDTITVDTDDTLQAAAAQLNGAGVTGAGTTVVRSLETSGADLSSVNSTAVSLDVTAGDASVAAGFQLGAGRAYSVIGGNTFNLTAATSLGLDAASSFVVAASTGLIADAADLDQVATSSGGSTTVRSLIGSTADLSELITTTVTLDIESANAAVGVGFDLAGRTYNVIGTGELDLTNATLSTSASYVLGSGTNLRINAADVTTVGITDTGFDSSVVVEALEGQADADLTNITASSLTASVVVANTVTLTGDLNDANLVIASVSGAPVLDVTSAGDIGSLDFGNNAAKAIISATQYAALSSISNLAGSQTIEIVDATNNAGTDALVTQVAGIEAYEINPAGADDDITFNLVAAGASANLTRTGSTAATVTLSAGETANFSGTWTSFAAGDVLNIVTSATVNVEGVSAGANLGGLQNVDVGSGSSFIAKAAQVSGAAITGAGTVNVTALDDTDDANLGNITTATVTAAVGLSDETVTFTGNLGKAAVTITGTSAGVDDIFNVDGATMGTATFSVGANAILQGSAAQLSGVTAAGSGTTAVTALHLTPAADLSGIGTTTRTAAFDGDGTFTGILNGAVVTVGDGFTMTAAANVVDGERIDRVQHGCACGTRRNRRCSG
ncbi:MAG: hypothetical protein ACMVO5_03350 [Polymorphobacter sp.]|uniref:hypothetical protein n=1 Tax=Polymorphobacter sp. TaxID=1909290 RepID=UPI003A83CE2D